MSYVCLIAGECGAAVANDTRVSRNYSGNKRFKIVSDNRTKSFMSDSGRVIWVLAGLTALSWTNYFMKIRRVMRDDDIPLELRLQSYMEIMKKGTARFHKRYKEDSSSTILYASYINKDRPNIGSITVKNGEVTAQKIYETPVFAETGSNYSILSPRSAFRPKGDEPVSVLKHLAIKRVGEAIEKDRQLSREDPKYRPAVGGRIQVKTVSRYEGA